MHRLAALLFLFLAPAAFAEVSLTSFGADPSGEHDSAPALQAAVNTLGTAAGTVLYIPPGTYRLSSSVTRNFANAPSSIVIRGEGSASILKIALSNSGRALQLQNLDSVLIENVTFIGSHTNGMAVDALYTLDFEQVRQATVRRCDFYGVTTVRGGAHGAPAGAVVYALRSDLRIESSGFHACAGDWSIGSTPFDGTPVVDNDEWLGFTLTDSEFSDSGTHNGTVYAGATSQASSAWVRLRTPASRVFNAANGQREAVIRRVRMDEGAFYGVAVRSGPGGDRTAAISISGLNVNGYNSGQLDQGTGVWIVGADNVRIEKSWFGWSQYASKYAIELLDAGTAVIDGVICDPQRLMRKIRATGQTNLTVRNSSYGSIDGPPATLSVGANEQLALSVPARVVQVNTNLKADDVEQVLVASVQGVTIALPNAKEVNGRTYTIKNESPGSITVFGAIDGTGPKTLTTQHAAITVTAAGGFWYVISQMGTVQ